MLSRCVLYCLLAATTLFCSCAGVRITTNEKKTRPSGLPPLTDSITVIGRLDRIPIDPGATVIGDGRIQGPTQSTFYFYKELLQLAKREAQRSGGNVIKVVKAHSMLTSSHSSSDIVYKIYNYSPSQLEALQTTIDKAADQHRDSLAGRAVVHIQFTGVGLFLSKVKYEALFNGKKIEEFRTKVTSFSTHNDVFQLSFEKSGTLAFTQSGDISDNFEVILGNEYWLTVNTSRTYKPYITPMTKDEFANDLWHED